MTVGTIVVLLVVAGVVALALRSVLKGESCGCESGKGCEGCGTKVYDINDFPDSAGCSPAACAGCASGGTCPHCK
ncbi:MAG: hypothetical protein Q4E12_02955 [Coriobacteriia bacterium]|nr:hypothetical protein [Coriobacteriia bacterium]